MKKIVIALGGNAILNKGEEGTFENQYNNVYKTLQGLVPILKDKDCQIVVTHGNGPQVGNLIIQNDLSKDTVSSMPMFVCGAMTQGQIGYMIQSALCDILSKNNIKREAVTFVTQVEVNKNDKAFEHPSKPVGPFYTEEEIEKIKNENPEYIYKKDANRGYRRVVPSPIPINIIEIEAIKKIFENNDIVITSGGGGIPVCRDKDILKGVDAVIDKDRAGALLSNLLGADFFIILTAVDKVYLNFNEPNQKALDEISLSDCKKYLKEGHFAEGSMKPKIEAIIEFLSKDNKRKALITSISALQEALNHNNGTWIVND